MCSGHKDVHFVNLPDIVIERIFYYLTFDEVSKNRVVCNRFNEMSKVCLNKGYFAARRYHAECTKEIKSKLPRRESERREHPLSGRADILSSIETRLSLLGMTYMKYIENGRYCFIPGKILDEFKRVMRVVMKETKIPSSSELLSELRDMSSMAMEHFDEHIIVKNSLTMLSGSTRYANKLISSFSTPTTNKMVIVPSTSYHNKSTTPVSNSWMSCFTSAPCSPASSTIPSLSPTQVQTMQLELKVLQSRVSRYQREMSAQGRRLQEQEGLIQEYSQRLNALEKHLNQPSESVVQSQPGTSLATKRKASAATQSSTSTASAGPSCKRSRIEAPVGPTHVMSRRSQTPKK